VAQLLREMTMNNSYISSLTGRFFKKNYDIPQDQNPGLSTFNGVFLPSLLGIFGVIMYLRLGAVIGSVGLLGSMSIVILSSAITLITGLSISATATNSHVGIGGAYYMISRAFGIEIGSAIGIALYLAQVIGLAFYIEGFSESVLFLYPYVDQHLLEGITLVLLTIIAMVSSSAALRVQLIIFLFIIASLVSIFTGSMGTQLPVLETGNIGTQLTYWGAFALFFPAVTGIEAGFSMSGDLKSPKKSLPIGTISAVLTGMIVYLVLCWFLSTEIPSNVLLSDSMILLNFSRFKSLVILGIWGATLSSAIGALLGAPRTLQALANDAVVPKFLKKTYGKANEPRNAVAITFLIACFCVYFGDINIIAPILSMFFLISYGMLNLASGIESFLDNPSWRPTFSTPSYISFTGSFLCIFAMLMIDAGSTFIAISIILFVYYFTSTKKLSKEWEDIQQGSLLFLARFAIYRLSKQKSSVRAWRPNFLVFSRSPTHRTFMIQLASTITNNKGFMTIASLLSTDSSDYDRGQRMEDLIREYLERKKIQSLVEVAVVENPLEGMKEIISSYGLGPIVPNTIVAGFSYKEDGLKNLVSLIFHASQLEKNIMIIKEPEEAVPEKKNNKVNTSKTIDLWWDDNHKKNNKLMLVFAHMIEDSKDWKNHSVSIKCVVPNEKAREQRIEYFNNFLSEGRLDADSKILVVPEEQLNSTNTIPMFCSQSGLLFVGLPSPQDGETEDDYCIGLKKIFQSVHSISTVIFILNNTEIDLDQIFN